MALWSAQNTWTACSFGVAGPPYINSDGTLAFARPLPTGRTAFFQSDTLTSFLEALDRRNVGFGLVLRSPSATKLGFATPIGTVPPVLRLVAYRPTAVAAYAARRQAVRR